MVTPELIQTLICYWNGDYKRKTLYTCNSILYYIPKIVVFKKKYFVNKFTTFPFFLLQNFADYMYVIIKWTIYKKLNKNG